MSEKSEAASRVITVALKELIRIAEEGGLPMLSYLLELALVEARTQGEENEPTPSNVIPLTRQ
ncbi:MAG: hypothetical protein LWW93_12180 [Hyphomicrobiales bacterium]|nr:hypothetical protein [Hyphomicrobiales bacterium]